MTEPVVVPSAHALRALSHPLRLRLLGLLRIDGPSTATSLAARTGTSSGATSYHLRQLAAHGFVEEAEGDGDARARWWRAVHRSTSTSAPRDADELAAVDAFGQAVAVVHAEQLQRAVEEYPLLPEEWRSASTLSDWVRRLRPERARALTEQLVELLSAVEDDDHPDARPFSVRVHANPWPGSVTDA
ncbi:helix-turn-helix domain-containing protein [Aeromicrobium sp.]|uniref:helix-turn-helix domain-containing protein n=1 Tax=Aeromicrobium sp. TaxID=1871063 RepID=UPI0035138090